MPSKTCCAVRPAGGAGDVERTPELVTERDGVAERECGRECEGVGDGVGVARVTGVTVP
jgi:hypothetical protein